MTKRLFGILVLFIILGSRYQAQAQSSDCGGLHPTILNGGCVSSCYGTSVLLDAGVGYSSYHWSNGATTQRIVINNPEASGDYVCTVTTSEGCTARTPSVHAMIRRAVPRPYLVQQNMKLIATDAAHYTWFYNGSMIASNDTNVLMMREPGEYSVMVTDENGCSTQSEPMSVTASLLQAPSRTMDARLKVYPNPSTGLISVQLISDFEGAIQFNVADMNGKEVFESVWKGPAALDIFRIDLSSLPDGAYFLNAHDGVDVVSEKIVIIH